MQLYFIIKAHNQQITPMIVATIGVLFLVNSLLCPISLIYAILFVNKNLDKLHLYLKKNEENDKNKDAETTNRV